MSAIIIVLAEWRARMASAEERMAQRGSQRLPSSIDVAMDHVMWLRFHHRALTPWTAGAMIGVETRSWAEVLEAYAAAWEALPEEVRRDNLKKL